MYLRYLQKHYLETEGQDIKYTQSLLGRSNASTVIRDHFSFVCRHQICILYILFLKNKRSIHETMGVSRGVRTKASKGTILDLLIAHPGQT